LLLIVGLGNPGTEYARTRHNAGFMLIDRLSEAYSIRMSRHGKGAWGAGRIAGAEVTLLKPLTYMNLSGQAVSELLGEYPELSGSLLLVYDDCDLPLGKVRIRKSGGSGGHRGLSSIINTLGTKDIPRVRLGIGRPEDGDVVEYVLSQFAPDDLPQLEEMLGRAREAVESIIANGIEQAMNSFNS